MSCSLAENILYSGELYNYQMMPLVFLILDFEDTIKSMLRTLDDSDYDSDPSSDLSKKLGTRSKFLTMLVAKTFTVEYNSMTETEKENNKELKAKVELIETSIKNIRDKVYAGNALRYLETLEDERLQYIKTFLAK